MYGRWDQSLELEITNTVKSPTDRRSEAPRQEYLGRTEALELLKKLAEGIIQLDAKSK